MWNCNPPCTASHSSTEKNLKSHGSVLVVLLSKREQEVNFNSPVFSHVGKSAAKSDLHYVIMHSANGEAVIFPASIKIWEKVRNETRGRCFERGWTITGLRGEESAECIKPNPALFFPFSLYSFRSVWPQSPLSLTPHYFSHFSDN